MKGNERGQPPYYETDKHRHDKTVELVTRMLDLKKQQSRAPRTRSSFIADSFIVEHRTKNESVEPTSFRCMSCTG
jgi:hypothetical protein